MALSAYITATQNLLQAPGAPVALYPSSSLTLWVNSARSQLAGESECLRSIGSLALTAAQQVYNMSAITISATGVASSLKQNNAWIAVASGLTTLNPRSFQWFTQYYLNDVTPDTGHPTDYAQYGQGNTGTIYVYPTPATSYTLKLDCVCRPIDLIDDSTAEAIPYPWTDAIPYFAAYLALLSAQSASRTGEAERMFKLYQEFLGRARRFSTPSVAPHIYSQSPNMSQANQLGIGGGGQ